MVGVRSADSGISARHVRRTPEFFDSQSHHEWRVDGRPGSRGSRIQRYSHHISLCAGAKSRRVCGPGQRNQQESLGAQHPDQTRRESGSRPGRTWGRNCPRMFDLCSLPLSPMNRRAKKPHLYSQATTLSARTSARYLPCSRRTKPPRSMKSWTGWSRKCRPPRFSGALVELELAGRVKQLPGKNFVKSF